MTPGNTTLPPIQRIQREVPTLGQHLGQLEQPDYRSRTLMPTSRQNIVFGPDGYEYINGPLTQDQQHILQGWLIGFVVLQHNHPGNNYIVQKKQELLLRAQETRIDDKALCLSRGGEFHKALFNCKPREYTESYKPQSPSFQLFLPAVSMSKSLVLQMRQVIPFIPADPRDTRLDLPGVSVARLLTKDQDILVNGNSFLENPKLGSDIQVIRVRIIIKGYEPRGRTITIPLECSHGFLTLLGLAYTVSDSICGLIREGPRTLLDETNMRLVAIYSTDEQGSLWNVAYAIAKV